MDESAEVTGVANDDTGDSKPETRRIRVSVAARSISDHPTATESDGDKA